MSGNDTAIGESYASLNQVEQLIEIFESGHILTSEQAKAVRQSADTTAGIENDPSYHDSRLPLGESLERRRGRSLPELHTFSRAVLNFLRLGYEFQQRSVSMQQPSCARYTLPLAQAKMLDVLWEWWDERLCKTKDQNTSESCKRSLMDFFRIASSLPLEHMKQFKLDDVENGAFIPPFARESLYSTACWALWVYEFYYYGNDVDARYLDKLYLRRQECLLIVTSQRVAHAVLPGVINEFQRSLLDVNGFTMGEPDFGSSLEACPWLTQLDSPLSEKKQRQWPRFLWDIEREATVDTSLANSLPAYRIISHTWGRWVKRDSSGNKVFCNMDNVPWPVPENTRFDVRELPTMLKKLQNLPNVGYVWIDLLCIPQEGAPEPYNSMGPVEIAKQAFIFQGASCPVIWLNEIDDWSGVQAAVIWISREFVNRTCPQARAEVIASEWDAALKTAYESADCHTGFGILSDQESSQGESEGDGNTNRTAMPWLLGDPEVVPETNITASVEPAGWFTSLWTLQEACLRPDMELYDRNFNLLEVGSCRKRISLDSLSALLRNLDIKTTLVRSWQKPGDLHQVHFDGAAWTRSPLSVKEMLSTFAASGLLDLTYLSPLDVLSLARQRYSKSSRVPAIVSVLDLQDWYLEQVEKGVDFKALDMKDMIQDMWPQDFLEAVRAMYGASFFTSNQSLSRDHLLAGVPGPTPGTYQGWEIQWKSVEGSLLPTRNGSRSQRFKPPKTVDHPSVSSWVLGDYGRIEIKEAAILTSSVATESGIPIAAKVNMQPFSQRPDSMIGDITVGDLQRFLRQCKPWIGDGELFAIVVQYNEEAVVRARGVILRHVSYLHFVKQGTFETFQVGSHEIPASKPVRWVVW